MLYLEVQHIINVLRRLSLDDLDLEMEPAVKRRYYWCPCEIRDPCEGFGMHACGVGYGMIYIYIYIYLYLYRS